MENKGILTMEVIEKINEEMEKERLDGSFIPMTYDGFYKLDLISVGRIRKDRQYRIQMLKTALKFVKKGQNDIAAFICHCFYEAFSGEDYGEQ